MTDGIIQKIFTNMTVTYLENTEQSIIALVNKTEQELIEKIKQEFKQDTYRDEDGLWSYPRYPSIEFVLMRLIGDNK